MLVKDIDRVSMRWWVLSGRRFPVLCSLFFALGSRLWKGVELTSAMTRLLTLHIIGQRNTTSLSTHNVADCLSRYCLLRGRLSASRVRVIPRTWATLHELGARWRRHKAVVIHRQFVYWMSLWSASWNTRLSELAFEMMQGFPGQVLF